MRTRPTRHALITLFCLPSLALGQETNGVAFTLGVGAQSQPEYFGAENSRVGPTGSFELERLKLGSFNLGGQDSYGFGFGGSFRFIGPREADDYPELDGLDDVDLAVEVGGGLEFNTPDYEVFAKLRYGVIGHEALVAEFGGDVFYRPTDQVTLSAGPRVLWGSDEFTQTYFGVTEAESVTSGFDAFAPDAGIVSAGVAAEAKYQFNETWGVTGKMRYDRLRDDAAESPITQSEDQLTGSLVLTRRISLGF
ncbi:MAG: MipA/OmpV family protein [Pseudomonadota bacterium]